MVHASTISRILIWYQQAAGWNSGCSAGSRPSASDSEASISADEASLPPAGVNADADSERAPVEVPPTGFAVAQAPVSMGTFSIKDENLQAIIRNQVVLSELNNAAKLIDCFMGQDHSESSGSEPSGLYSHLGVWLQGEHSKTVKMLKARISVLSVALQF